MLQRTHQLSGQTLAHAAAERCGLAHDTPEMDALVQSHTAMCEAAIRDFQLDPTRLPLPEWLMREVAPYGRNKPLEGLELYCAKEHMRARHLSKYIMPLLAEVTEGKIVDIGARSGFVPHRMQQLSDMDGYDRQITGLDLPQPLPTDGTAFDHTRGENPIMRHYDGEIMPYADGELAAVTLNFTLHHVEEPSRTPSPDSERMHHFLDETNRVLKPGGVVVVTEDFMGNTEQVRKAGNPYADTVLQTDDIFYPHSLGCQRSQEEWKMLLEQHGFTVELEKHIASYNAAGFPVVELLMKARKIA